MPDVLTLEELITLIRTVWADRYSRGRVLHVHRNALELPNGARIHLRVLVQTITDPPKGNNP